MERVPEPELMLQKGQARAYASADFKEPHDLFIGLLRERLCGLPPHGCALDLGCGPGDITLRFARAFPGWTIDAIDGSPPMLDLARRAAVRDGVQSRVHFCETLIPQGEPPRRGYDLLFTNSLLHHLAEPGALWSTLIRWGKGESFVFVMDLLRPKSRPEAQALVDRYASSEPEVLRMDFYNSLLAAYRPGEVREQLARADVGQLAFEVVSNRHFIVWGRLRIPGPPAA